MAFILVKAKILANSKKFKKFLIIFYYIVTFYKAKKSFENILSRGIRNFQLPIKFYDKAKKKI